MSYSHSFRDSKGESAISQGFKMWILVILNCLLGGKYMLISNFLHNILIYLVFVIVPLPKCVIHDLHRVFERFLWIFKNEGMNKYWVAWSYVYFPKIEGGLGFWSLFDVPKAIFAELWWNFMIKRTSLGKFYVD